MSDWVYERMLSSHLSFSLHGLRYRLPKAERQYWEEYVGKRITIDDEYEAGILLIEPRRVANSTNLYAVAVVRGGYAWLQNVYERVHRAEDEFLQEYCKTKGWDPIALTMQQSIEITEQPGYRHAGEILRRKT
jgi:hypothetical protein